MSFQIRNVLMLKDDSSLTKEEIWLKEAYANIIRNLIQSVITQSPNRSSISKTSQFDPFMEKFMGIDNVGYDKFDYKALLEITSYVWASKGGRGTLLEKIICSLGGKYADSTVNLLEIFSILRRKLNDEKKTSLAAKSWTINNNVIKGLKFDLVNCIDDRLILMEIKNRVDSGGTSAREESLNKKFIELCKLAEGHEKIFHDGNRSYDLISTLKAMGIAKLELYMGLLFNRDGNEASIEGDKSGGFYSSSRTSMKNYVNKPHNSEVVFDEKLLKISLTLEGFDILVAMLYGNDIMNVFTSKLHNLQSLNEKVFSGKWDDFWLIFNIAISERAMLLRKKTNYIMQIYKLKESDPEFAELLSKFCSRSSDLQLLERLTKYSKENLIPYPSGWEYSTNKSYLSDCLYSLASYIMSESFIIRKSRKRTLKSSMV